MRPNANNLASKHFPVDFFNQKNKKSMLPTNDDTIGGTSFENGTSEQGTQDYVMKTSLTIDYDKPVDNIGDQLNSFI